MGALTLPQPFTIIESGNFCGGTTGFIALLRRELCPRCPYLSLDPGAYRRKRHARFTCHRASLDFAGLGDDVEFVDKPSPAIATFEQPVGFVYVDGGKVRFCNDPLHSFLEDRMMVGSLVGLDDVWQGWPGAPHSVEHVGQIAMVHELMQTGDWHPLIVPPMPHRHHENRSAAAGSVGAKMLGAIRDASSGVVTSKESIMGVSGAPKAPLSNDFTRRDLFPENIKQALIAKSRSRFEQPGEREGADALRVVLIERGGGEVANMWASLPTEL